MRTPPPPEMICGFLIQLVFCKKKTLWFIGVESRARDKCTPSNKKSWIRPCVLCCLTLTSRVLGQISHVGLILLLSDVPDQLKDINITL